jgi:glyoxylase-like metal-dependent hydrolase (beta-lactamase superfamily II)
MTPTDSVDAVELRVVVAPVFGTNCCVVSSGTDCVVVDAGAGVADAVGRLVDDAGLTPRAVLATHGHADHTWDAGVLCARYEIPMRLHEADAYRLADPFGTLSPALQAALGLHRDDYQPPARSNRSRRRAAPPC